MTTLHLIRSSAFSTNLNENCDALLNEGDTIALLDDAVYNINHVVFMALVSKKSVTVHAIDAHIKARGITMINTQNQPDSLITIEDIIKLSLEHTRSITWQ